MHPILAKSIALFIVSIGKAEEYSAIAIYHRGFSCDYVTLFDFNLLNFV